MKTTQAAVNWQRRTLTSRPPILSQRASKLLPSSPYAASSYQHSSPLVSSKQRSFSQSHRRPSSFVIAAAAPSFGPSGLGSILTQRRLVSTSASSQTATMAAGGLESGLTYELLDGVREFWYEHFESDDSFILPQMKEQMRWFRGGKEMDDICIERFCPALEAIRAAGITSAEGLLSVLPPRNPLDWLSLVILLDQIPRNCYRGPAAGVAFSVFDPLARGVALAAMDIGIPHAQPEVRWAFARRFWFYLPLMHSEDMAVHERAVAEYGRMVADIDALVAASQQGAAEVPAEQREVVRVIGADVEGAKTMAKLQMEFEMKHYDIIKQFGRYPHRNAALGRETTAEEKEYLENGGETFGG